MRFVVLVAALLVIASCSRAPQPVRERLFGELTAIEGRVVTIHEMRMLTGDAADAAYKAETGRDGGPPTPLWLVDLRRDRELGIDPDLAATVLTWNGAGDTVTLATDLAGLVIARDAGRIAGNFYWLDVRDGIVVRMDAQVVP